MKNDEIPFGTKDKCSFESKSNGGNRIVKYNSVCAAGSNTENSALGWAIASPFVFGVLLFFTIVLMCVFFKCGKDKYQELMENNN